MPELARSIAARLRRFVGDRRRAERCRLQLPFALSLLGDRPTGSATQTHSIEGHTLDVSTTGLALIVPAIRIGDHYLAGEGRILRIDLELPVGPIVIHASAVRYERLDEDENEKGYLIGVNITAMSDSDRARYNEYVGGFLTK
ncbi:MAG: PilZ domain-containing protein [Acidobacteriota bacterium]|nr:PilZ domain-containing protein [Acidobacteriota bacterium]